MEPKSELKLPPIIIGPVDLGKVAHELDSINEIMLQLKLRQGGDAVELPKTSLMLERLAGLNGLNLLDERHREQLTKFVNEVKDTAPVAHMSFGTDPSPAFLEKLTNWLRSEINPYVLITIGIQPTIGAGCILRSTNHYFDLSIKQTMQKSINMLSELLAPPSTPAPATNIPVPNGVVA